MRLSVIWMRCQVKYIRCDVKELWFSVDTNAVHGESFMVQ